MTRAEVEAWGPPADVARRIVTELMAKGIPIESILPNTIWTYEVWLALGRIVKKGEHGVTLALPPEGRGRLSVTLFHLSQTEPIPTQPAP